MTTEIFVPTEGGVVEQHIHFDGGSYGELRRQRATVQEGRSDGIVGALMA